MLLRSLFAAVAAIGAVAQNTTSELDLILQRRRVDMAEFATADHFAQLPTWIESQREDGTWADVNYLAGCPAQRANWPIQAHWVRVIALASAWSGLNPASTQYAGKEDILAKALKGMDWWFANDYTNEACMSQGGSAACPCGTPGLWNTNWFGSTILMPQLVSTACVILQPANLTTTQREGCIRIPKRPYNYRESAIPGIGVQTGANAVNIAQNSVSLAVFAGDEAMLKDSLDRAFGAVTFEDKAKADGIHRDGSFLQHAGILYNGNYGKALLEAFVQLEGEVIGTSYAAKDPTREAFAAEVRGSEWMIYVDEDTRQEHWDFNVIGRFVAFKTDDLQVSADISFNVSKLAKATADFTGANSLKDTTDRLLSNGTIKLTGNKGFWASDYMVHRRDKYVLGNKMLSTRSTNSEFTNSANPYGYHLGQGTLFSYAHGNEYKDIMASWDWNLVPGTTVVLNYPALSGNMVTVSGKKDFVGVVSDNNIGMSAMDYVDPRDASLSYKKVWVFLDDSVVVLTSDVASTKGPVVTVLDQRAARGAAVVDGQESNSGGSAKTLYYDGKGYLAHSAPFNLTLKSGPATGNWSAISTSLSGVQTVDLFSAYTTVDSSFAYEFFPSIDAQGLAKAARKPTTTPIMANGTLGAVSDGVVALAFFGGSLSAEVDSESVGWKTKFRRRRGNDKGNNGNGNGNGNGGNHNAPKMQVSTSAPGLYLLRTSKASGKTTLHVTASDPTQKLAGATLTVHLPAGKCNGKGNAKCKEANGVEVQVDVTFPTGGMAGSSVSYDVPVEV